MRIIGGTHRSRWIAFPDVADLRPTPDRVRETLFNWLGQNLAGKRCLDLFSGSGVIGFEAVSRGAEAVVMVESNRTAFRSLQETGKKLACTNVTLYCEDGLGYLRRENTRFDVIFLDPPFQSDILPKAMPVLLTRLTENGVVYVETGEPFEPGSPWQVVKQARAGKVYFQLLQCESEST